MCCVTAVYVYTNARNAESRPPSFKYSSVRLYAPAVSSRLVLQDDRLHADRVPNGHERSCSRVQVLDRALRHSRTVDHVQRRRSRRRRVARLPVYVRVAVHRMDDYPSPVQPSVGAGRRERACLGRRVHGSHPHLRARHFRVDAHFGRVVVGQCPRVLRQHVGQWHRLRCVVCFAFRGIDAFGNSDSLGDENTDADSHCDLI